MTDGQESSTWPGATVCSEHADGSRSPYYAVEVFLSDLHLINLPD